jgi:hypothetical protein
LLFPKQTRGKGDAGEIILINGDVPRIIVRALEAVLVNIERREGESGNEEGG